MYNSFGHEANRYGCLIKPLAFTAPNANNNFRRIRMDDRISKLAEKAKSLPKAPGVYLMKDDKGRVIYVGKSASARPRRLVLPARDKA